MVYARRLTKYRQAFYVSWKFLLPSGGGAEEGGGGGGGGGSGW